MTRRPLILLAAAGLLALASCSLRNNTTRGELSNGQFTYRCVDSSDAACDDPVGTAAVPALLAVGGTFDLEYVGDATESSPVQLKAASEKMLSGASGNFEVLLPGVSAVLARDTSGVVADFIHLRGVNIDHLDVSGPSSTKAVTQVQMDIDKEIELQVVPKDELGARLAGAFPYAWSTSDFNVISLSPISKKNRVTLTAFSAGTATVEVSLPSGEKMAVVVTVKQGMNTSSSSGGEGGAGSSTGSTGAGGAGGGK
ncbi:MAG: hypothetical protein ABI134_03765 [Byssovorax sp.]